MLVLDRRPAQSLCFSELGITIQVFPPTDGPAGTTGMARPEIRVLHSLPSDGLVPAAACGGSRISCSDRTRQIVADRMKTANMAIHLARRHLSLNRPAEAQTALDHAVSEFCDVNMLVRSLGTQPLRILLVESDGAERLRIATDLQRSGFQVATASDEQGVTEYLSSEERPDVVVLNWQLDACSGPDTTARIRETPHLDGLKVFGISECHPRDSGVRTGPRGVDGWFGRPLSSERLVQALKAMTDSEKVTPR